MTTECIRCGKDFETNRSSGSYCSNSCRSSAYKQRKKDKQTEEERIKAQQEREDRENKIRAENRKKREQKAEEKLKAQEQIETAARLETEAKQREADRIAAELEEKSRVLVADRLLKEESDRSAKKLKEIANAKKLQIETEKKMNEYEEKAKVKIVGVFLIGAVIYKIGEALFKPPVDKL